MAPSDPIVLPYDSSKFIICGGGNKPGKSLNCTFLFNVSNQSLTKLADAPVNGLECKTVDPDKSLAIADI